MIITATPSTEVFRAPRGITARTCESCGETFHTSTPEGRADWKRHQEMALKASRSLQWKVPDALNLIGLSFRVVYTPRYPEHSREVLGETAVRVVGVHIQEQPCSLMHGNPKLVFDKAIPTCEARDGTYIMVLNDTVFHADWVRHQIQDKGYVTYQPCGKDAPYVEKDIRAALEG